MPSKSLLLASFTAACGVALAPSVMLNAAESSNSPPAAQTEHTISEAPKPDYDAHITALRETLLTSGFTIVRAEPFVVIGNESPERVRLRAERTVGWAVRMLKAEYFEHDPDHIIDIWLLKDKASYEAQVNRLFGREPHTPYGFYSAPRRMMLMNIATGGGTLVHEIVHPFVAANFPECPSWFNEGLGSLYEQSAERDGRIVGLTNWRLAGLQNAIQRSKTVPLPDLITMTSEAFYDDKSGLHYAEARYLCYYLQHHGLLQRYYHTFVENHDTDPTGYTALRHVLNGEADDMAAFQRRWETWVAGLRFP